MTESDARLRAALGTEGAPPLDRAASAAAEAWTDGFGVVAPDVVRYGDVLRAVPDPVLLAMRTIADTDDVEVVDPDTATLISLLARSHRPRQVLEVGTGIGYLTVHLARAVQGACLITSIDPDPMRQEQAHAFLERDERARCATELRLGDPARLLREGMARTAWDIVVLGSPTEQRLDLLDIVAPRMAPDALLIVPWALRGGRVANSEAAWNGDQLVEHQRLLNRCIATDPRFGDVVLLPVGDGVLLARRV